MNTKKKPTLKMTVLFLALILSLVPLGMVSAKEDINAILTAVDGDFTIGDRIPLNLSVTHPSGYRLLPLQFKDSALGELEIREVIPSQVIANPDGTETTRQTIYATLWTPGEYNIPELSLTLSDTEGEIREIKTSPLSLEVTSVLVEGDTELRDIKPQASLPLPPIWPWFAGGLFALLLVVLIAGWLSRRWWLRRQAAMINAPDLRLLHEVAFDELAHIESLNLPQQHRFKEHYTLISDVLRQYVEISFQIPTLDRTTGEIRRAIKLAPFNQDNICSLIELLNEADLVKFAKVQPEISSAQDYLIQARHFVGENRPLEVVTSNGNGQTPNDGYKTEGFDLQHNTSLMEAK